MLMNTYKKHYYKIQYIICFFCIAHLSLCQNILIPMDENNQKNHLKSYGLAYWVLEQDIEVDWLLNFRGGSFMFHIMN